MFNDGIFGGLMQIENFYSDGTSLRREKSTPAQSGRPFEELRALEEMRRLTRMVSEKFGTEMAPDDPRPAEGAFPIVDERVVALWLTMLEANGLRRFVDRISIDWFTRNEVVEKGALEAYRTPVASEPVFRFPRGNKDAASVMFRIAITDPRFVDAGNRPLNDKMPEEYIIGVLNTLNPYVIYQILGKSLPDLLLRAGEQAQPFDQLIKYVAGKAKNKVTPADFETLQDYVHAMLIHEMVHALCLHLPDQVPQDLPDNQRKSLEAISFERYLALITTDQSLSNSALFFKDLIKALQKVQKKEPNADTAADVIDLIALEMFCDRFSMYLYENFLKIHIYNRYLHEMIGYPVTIDMLITMEEARRTNRLSDRHEVSRLGAEALRQLQEELAAAELDHVFIRRFGEPAVTLNEREFFTGFLKWLKHLDRENQIMRFTMQHADTSRFMHVSVAGMTWDAGMNATMTAGGD